jgi:hypothetical protein
MMRAISFSACCLTMLLATGWLAKHAPAANASDSADHLRAAGIEPTVEGIRTYFQLLVGGEAPRHVAQLIVDLGSEDFTVRERASRELAEVVPLPISELTAASKGDDAERALRAQRILKTAKPQNAKTVAAALDVIAAQKLAVGLPLLLKLYFRLDAADAKAQVLSTAIAIVQETDRALLEGFVKEKDKTTQDLGRVLLARLDKKDLPLDLARNYDAVKVIPGNVGSGGSNLVAGWEFKTKADLTVTHLGIFDRKPAGLNVPHEVALWDLDDSSKPLALETIPAGEKALLAGEFRLVSTARIRLKADRNYAIVAHYPDTSDSTVSRINPNGLTIEYAPHLEVIGRRYTFPQPAMAFPARAQIGSDHATIGPTFRYETLEVGK